MAQTAVSIVITRLTSSYAAGLLLSLGPPVLNALTMTHELIANMLGVRREGVTEAAHKCGPQRHTYSRAKSLVLDRPKMERLCWRVLRSVKKETDRLLRIQPINDTSLCRRTRRRDGFANTLVIRGEAH